MIPTNETPARRQTRLTLQQGRVLCALRGRFSRKSDFLDQLQEIRLTPQRAEECMALFEAFDRASTARKAEMLATDVGDLLAAIKFVNQVTATAGGAGMTQ